jgi:hypothetical protein
MSSKQSEVEPSSKKWDVFVSHASEDTEAVAVPLADHLSRAGLRVWLDEHVLSVGDSLREKIDEGLAASRFGVVIVSPAFLRKRWPARELNGLFAIEESGTKVILSVWHQVSKEQVAQYSPILADRLAADTAKGLRKVAGLILRGNRLRESKDAAPHSHQKAGRDIGRRPDWPSSGRLPVLERRNCEGSSRHQRGNGIRCRERLPFVL